MRSRFWPGCLAVALVSSLPCCYAAAPAKGAASTMVIVFKDGHKQAINLADIDHVEYPLVVSAASTGEPGPSRGRFFGKWEVGDGAGNNFYITLLEGGEATRSSGNVHGKWVYANGEADVTWDDGAQDALRREGTRYEKFAYSAGKHFTDAPDNVTNARNTSPKPI